MKKIITIAASFLALGITAFAQFGGSNSAYFLDGYNYRHLMNPAFAPQRSYFALFGISGVNTDISTNIGIDKFCFPIAGNKMASFMSPEVSAERFLSKLKPNQKSSFSFDMPVLSVGISGKGDAFTVAEIRVKSMTSMNLPRELFEFMKSPMSNTFYDMSDIAARTSNYVEISAGHSRKIGENLRVGGKLKFLVGAADADVTIDKLHVTMNDQAWKVSANYSAKGAAPFLIMPESRYIGTNLIDYFEEHDPFDTDNGKWNNGIGYGVAVDLGATFKFDGLLGGILDGLTVSAAVNDFGFIRHSKYLYGVAPNDEWVFEGFHDIPLDSDKDNQLKDQIDALGEDFGEFIKPKIGDTKGHGSFAMPLACKVNVSAEYEMPFYRNLSVGILSSSYIYGVFSATEGRIAANLKPCNWFNFSTSYSVSTFGQGLGFSLGFSLPGFGMFFNMDSIPVKYSKPYALDLGDDFPMKLKVRAPLGNLGVRATWGIVFNLGKYHERL